MAKENIELHIIHNPKLTTEDNGFAVAVFIDGVDKNLLELSKDQMLHIGAILLNVSNKFIKYADNNKAYTDMATAKTTSVSTHDTYSCTRPENIETMECCKTCTSRQPNINCKFLKIETVYTKD